MDWTKNRYFTAKSAQWNRFSQPTLPPTATRFLVGRDLSRPVSIRPLAADRGTVPRRGEIHPALFQSAPPAGRHTVPRRARFISPCFNPPLPPTVARFFVGAGYIPPCFNPPISSASRGTVLRRARYIPPLFQSAHLVCEGKVIGSPSEPACHGYLFQRTP